MDTKPSGRDVDPCWRDALALVRLHFWFLASLLSFFCASSKLDHHPEVLAFPPLLCPAFLFFSDIILPSGSTSPLLIVPCNTTGLGKQKIPRNRLYVLQSGRMEHRNRVVTNSSEKTVYSSVSQRGNFRDEKLRNNKVLRNICGMMGSYAQLPKESN